MGWLIAPKTCNKNDSYVPQLRSKFQVFTFSRFKVIAFFIFVYEFVKYAGKNIRTSDAKRHGSPNYWQAVLRAKSHPLKNLWWKLPLVIPNNKLLDHKTRYMKKFLRITCEITTVRKFFECLEKWALNLIILFTPRHYTIKDKAFARNLGILEKIYGLLFFRFNDCKPFEGGPGANVSSAFLFNLTPLGSSGYFLKLNTLC